MVKPQAFLYIPMTWAVTSSNPGCGEDHSRPSFPQSRWLNFGSFFSKFLGVFHPGS